MWRSHVSSQKLTDGTASGGGVWGSGTAFALKTNGADFTTLHSFSYYDSGGANPQAGLILSSNTLYGMTYNAGRSGYGTVFSISFRPQLTIASSSTNVILTWPTNYAGFDYASYILQSTTNLPSPMAWVTSSAAPVIINGQNTVTHPVTGGQKFYRLIQ